MRRIEVGENESGQRLDRLVSRILTGASWGEVQKLFRKKVFKVNGRRMGNPAAFVQEGDVLEIFLSDESFEKLGGKIGKEEHAACSDSGHPSFRERDVGGEACISRNSDRKNRICRQVGRLIVFEDDDFLVVNKSSGILTHRDRAGGEDDLTSMVRVYLEKQTDRYFTPAAASRLDRGTSGLIVFAKNYRSLKRLNQEVREHRMRRFYLCVAEGMIEEDFIVEGQLIKDESSNRVQVLGGEANGDGKEVKTIFHVLKTTSEGFQGVSGGYTLLSAEIITGRSHQIRASLCAVGHPIAGDRKYGSHQNMDYLLCCNRLELLGRSFEIDSEPIRDFCRSVF